MTDGFICKRDALCCGRIGKNRIDGGAHFYDTYETSDGKYITIAAAEPQFYELLLDLLKVADEGLRNDRMNAKRWPEFKEKFEAIFKTRTRDEWDELLQGTDVCYAPVLDFEEAPRHLPGGSIPHLMGTAPVLEESHGRDHCGGAGPENLLNGTALEPRECFVD